jgi:hypothetical protein
MKQTLKGNWHSKKVFLNGEILDITPSLNFLNYSKSFGWGKYQKAGLQLALAIMLKLTGSYDGFFKFYKEVLKVIPENTSFNIQFELEGKTKMIIDRKIAITNAHGYNKYLTKDILDGKLNQELLCYVHPLERESLSNILITD